MAVCITRRDNQVGLGPPRGALAELGVGPPSGIHFRRGGGLHQTPLENQLLRRKDGRANRG
jgi:hypothetical protein